MTVKVIGLIIGILISCFGIYYYYNNSDYLQKARKYGHFTGYKN